MTNPQAPAPIDFAELRAAIAEHSAATSGQTGSAGEAHGTYLITRCDGDAFWSLTIRTSGGPIRACTGTDDQDHARAIATAIQADADARRFAPKVAPTDARSLALLNAIDWYVARRRRGGTSETKAGDGRSEVRKRRF